MFTDSELSANRRASEAAMPDTFRVQVPGAWVDDGSGGGYRGPPTDVDFPCRKAPLGNGPQEQLLAQQIQAVGLEVICVAWDAEIGTDAAGTYIRAETGATQSYTVRGIPESTYSIHKRLLVAPQGA